jgi:hypothetical protein
LWQHHDGPWPRELRRAPWIAKAWRVRPRSTRGRPALGHQTHAWSGHPGDARNAFSHSLVLPPAMAVSRRRSNTRVPMEEGRTRCPSFILRSGVRALCGTPERILQTRVDPNGLRRSNQNPSSMDGELGRVTCLTGVWAQPTSETPRKLAGLRGRLVKWAKTRDPSSAHTLASPIGFLFFLYFYFICCFLI